MAFSVVGQCLHYRVTDPVIRMLVSPQEYASYEPERLAEHITELTLGGIRTNRARQAELARPTPWVGLR